MTQSQTSETPTTFKTNHLWHACLSVFSLGGWLPVWITIGLYNWYKRWHT